MRGITMTNGWMWDKERVELKTRIENIVRIRTSSERSARDEILDRMFCDRIRGICRVYQLDEARVLSGFDALCAERNGVPLEKEVEDLIASCERR